MRKEVYLCDNCGEEMNPFDDYTDMDSFYDFDITGKVDLCTNCHKELCDMIKKFVRK